MGKVLGYSEITIANVTEPFNVLLTNEAQQFYTDSNRKIITAQTYYTDVIVHRGSTQRTDFTIGNISSANNITVSKSGSRITFKASAGIVISAEAGTFTIPITLDGETVNKTFSWTLGKQGEIGATGLKALQTTRNWNGTFTTIGQTTSCSVSDFNRTPVVGDTFTNIDGSSNTGTWQVTAVSGSNITIKLVSYVNSKGDTGESGESFAWNLLRYAKGDSKQGLFKNFEKVTDEYAEVTLKSKKTHTDVDVSYGFLLDNRDYVVGQQVTWSYDIMFTTWDFPTGANRTEWWFGQRYTQPPTGETGTGNWRMTTGHTLPSVGQNGCELNKWYHVEKTITIPEQASSNVGGDGGLLRLYNSNADVEATVTLRLKNVKLEYASKASAWCPAEEEIYGKDGTSVTISSKSVTYQVSTSGTTTPTGNWSSTIPDVSNGQYLWTKTTVIYSDGNKTEAYGVSYKGTNGTSVTITQNEVTYQVSSSGTTTPTGTWSATMPTYNKGQYLWTKTYVKYSDGKSTTSYSVSYKGIDGADGDSFSWNMLSYNNLEVGSLTAVNNNASVNYRIRFKDSIDVNAGEKYVITPYSFKDYIGVRCGIHTIQADGTAVKDSGWIDLEFGKPYVYTMPDKAEKCRIVFSFSKTSKTVTTNDTECKDTINKTDLKDFTIKIEKGSVATPWAPHPDDLEGRSVSQIVQYYLATSSANGVTSSTSGWSTDITTQKITAEKKYLWNCHQTKYSDGSSDPITTPTIIGVYGDKGQKGDTGESGESFAWNLLRETNQGATNWGVANNLGQYSKEAFVTEDGINGVKFICAEQTTSWVYWYLKNNDTIKTLKPSTDYTLSYDIKSNIKNGYLRHSICLGNGTGRYINAAREAQIKGEDKWEHVCVCFTTKDTLPTFAEQVLYIGGSCTSNVGESIIKNIKLVEGTIDTPWSPHQDDLIGEKGDKGDTGKSVKGLIEYYLASSLSTGVTSSTSGWTTTLQQLTATKKYLWNCHITEYSDGTKSQASTPVIIGTYGDKGDTGSTGVSISSVTEYYATSHSGNTAPSIDGKNILWTDEHVLLGKLTNDLVVKDVGADSVSLYCINPSSYLFYGIDITNLVTVGKTYTVSYKASGKNTLVAVDESSDEQFQTRTLVNTSSFTASADKYYRLKIYANTTADAQTTTYLNKYTNIQLIEKNTPWWQSGSIPVVTDYDKYLWNYKTIAYSNGTKTNTAAGVISIKESAPEYNWNLFKGSSLTDGRRLLCTSVLGANSVLSHGYTDEGYHVVTKDVNQYNNGCLFYFNDYTELGLKELDTITFSCDIKGSTLSTYPNIAIHSRGIDSFNYTWWGEKTHRASSTINLSSEWQRFSVTTTIPRNQAGNQLWFACHVGISADVYIRNLKLEKSDKASAWCPAEEEITGSGFSWNLISCSKDFNGFSWGTAGSMKLNREIIQDATAPSGYACKITTTTAGGGGNYITGKNYANQIKKGDIVTVSVWCKGNTSKDIGVMSVEFLSNHTTYIIPNLSTEWQQYVITGIANKDVTTTSAGSTITFYYGDNMEVGDELYISSPKIEKGYCVTDWCTTYEESLVKSISINPSTQIFKSTDGGRVFSPDTITLTPVIQGSIAFSKWQYSIDGGITFTNVTNGQKGLTVNSTNVLSISKNSELFTDTITSIVFKATTNENSFYDVTTIIRLYDITDMGDGRNLLWNSNFSNTDQTISNSLTNWGLHTRDTNITASIDTSEKHNGFNTLKLVTASDSNQNSGNDIEWFAYGISEIQSGTNYFAKEQSYTLSFYAKSNVKTDFIVRWGYDGYATDTTRTLSTEWQRYEIPMHTAQKTYARCLIFKLLSASTVYFSEFKLEKGSCSTGYSKAPEDIETAILTNKTEINTVSQTVDKNKKAIQSKVEQTVYDDKVKVLEGRLDKAEEGVNKWKYEIYPKSLFDANDRALYSMALFARNKNLLPAKTILLNDATLSTSNSYGDQYIAYALTFVKFSEATTFSGAWWHDDGASFYLNGKLISQEPCNYNSTTGAVFNCTFGVGWNCLEVVLNEGSGGDGFKFSETISQMANCQMMNCYYGMVTGRENQITNTLVQQIIDSEGISNTVQEVMSAVGSSGEIEEFKNNYSTWKQKVDGIETRVSSSYTKKTDFDSAKKKLDNLDVGGRNLLRYSNDVFGYNNTEHYNTNAWLVLEESTFNNTPVYSTKNQWGRLDFSFKKHVIDRSLVKVGDVFTYSMMAKTNMTDGARVKCAYRFVGANGASWFDPRYDLDTEWKKVSATFTITEKMLTDGAELNAIGFEVLNTMGTGDKVYFACPKLERGTFATDYTVAPEDTELLEEYGGVNLISNLSTNWENGSFNISSDAGSSYSDVKDVKYDSATALKCRLRTKNLVPIYGDKITISSVKTQNSSGKDLGFYIVFFDENKKYLGQGYSSINAWKKTNPIQIYRTQEAKYIAVAIRWDLTNDFSISPSEISDIKLKIEVGHTATAYTPAPSDVDGRFENVESIATQTADKFTWLVKSGTDASHFSITDKMMELISRDINLTGKVTFNSFGAELKDKVTGIEDTASDAKEAAKNALIDAKNYTDDTVDGLSTNLVISSSNGSSYGTVESPTVLKVTVKNNKQSIVDYSSLTKIFGEDAYLQWMCKEDGQTEFQTIPQSDKRITDNGFTFTPTYDDGIVQTSFNCRLIVNENGLTVDQAGVLQRLENQLKEYVQNTLMTNVRQQFEAMKDEVLAEMNQDVLAQIQKNKDDITELKNIIKDLQYIAIEITTFKCNCNIVEMGSTIKEVTLNWTMNKVPESLTLDGNTIAVDTSSRTLTNQSVKSNKQYTLKATDDHGATSTKIVSITFYNGIYYGASNVPEEINSAFVLELTRSLQSGRVKTFSVNTAANEYIWYALPSRYGTPLFNVGGFDGGFTKVATIDFTNASGYTEKYDVWKSDNANLGTKTVKVS